MPTALKDLIKMMALFCIASLLAYILKSVGEAIDIIVVIYVLMVVLVSRVTNGYLWGILASIFGVLSTNFIFTFPYFKFNFMLTGYPITFCVMLATSMITSALTSNYKKQKEAAEEMNRKLQQSYEEQRLIERTAEKEKMKSNLLRSISHDLRTPLTSIRGASSAILEGGDRLSEETRRNLLEDISNESQWLIRMVENLLSVTHISEDTMRVTKTPQVAEEIIAETVSHFNSSEISQKIQVIVPDELVIVPMDATLIEQVILNFLDNALKHTVCSTEITLRLFVEENNAVFQISDNGIGIPPEEMNHLFEYSDFKQKKVSSDSHRGFGIGLPICKTIILAHSGKIWAESVQGEGTTFSFSLPLEDSEEKNAQ